jgi:hypothetical protein
MKLTILDLTFDIAAPYEEGQMINAAEAKTLNQTRKENISNALRKQIGELRSEDGTYSDEAAAKAAELVSTYDAEYAFSISAGGSSRETLSPVEREARAIAKLKVNEAIAAKGIKIKDYDKAAYEAKIAEVAANSKVVALAEKRVAERSKIEVEV